MTELKRKNMINTIQEYLEDNESMSEKTQGFLESIQEWLISGKDLTVKQKDVLTDIIGFGYLK